MNKLIDVVAATIKVQMKGEKIMVMDEDKKKGEKSLKNVRQHFATSSLPFAFLIPHYYMTSV